MGLGLVWNALGNFSSSSEAEEGVKKHMGALVSNALLFWISSTALVLILLISIIKFLYSVWIKPKMVERYLNKQGVKGPSYKFMYGNAKEMMMLSRKAQSKPMNISHDIMPRVNPFLQNKMMEYGKMFLVWFGTTPRVIILDPKLIRDFMSNKTDELEKLKLSSNAQLFVTGVAKYEGDKWVKHRKILNPAFHMEKLKRMLPAFSICCNELINKWDNLVASTGSSEVDVWPEFRDFTGDVISRAAFGSSFEEGRRIFQLQIEQAQLFFKTQRVSAFSVFSFLPSKENSRRKEIYNEVRALLRKIIVNRMNAIRRGEMVKDDLLGLLMESNLNESQSGNSMTMDEVIEECKLFYFAGQETTSILLSWTMVLLGMNPDWQNRARDEVLQVFGESEPNFDDLSKLKIMTMILNEVLRLYPPTTTLLRTTRKKIKLGDIYYPAGVQLFTPVHMLHHDPDLWGEDVNEFNPERFSGGIAKASKDQLSFFPFGWGPRICIGQNFALIEAKVALSKILQHFSFELSPSYAHAPQVLLNLYPQRGAQIILRKL
ncbi:Cytochrome P450 [Macleaya cordata]|uniref:Cytochrome P450 n=1 Tax=Macleaya cordata TaxID=56857 RepID=A0A200PQ40_MACCD|nr:Cytochrome P450 [Macleaya cordata]